MPPEPGHRLLSSLPEKALYRNAGGNASNKVHAVTWSGIAMLAGIEMEGQLYPYTIVGVY